MNFYDYKLNNLTCPSCGKKAKGPKWKVYNYFDGGFEIGCPKCSAQLNEIILFPTKEEVIKFGTSKEKAEMNLQMSFWEEYEITKIKDISTFPELTGKPTIFRMEEKRMNRKDWLVISANDIEIARELLTYEYYERYWEIGLLLKEKYGNLIKDLEFEKTPYISGDSGYAGVNLREYRKKLFGRK